MSSRSDETTGSPFIRTIANQGGQGTVTFRRHPPTQTILSLRGSLPMTISADYFALVDFFFDACKRSRTKTRHIATVFISTVYVIEVENYRIAFAAINTWMNAQIFVNPFVILFTSTLLLLAKCFRSVVHLISAGILLPSSRRTPLAACGC